MDYEQKIDIKKKTKKKGKDPYSQELVYELCVAKHNNFNEFV